MSATPENVIRKPIIRKSVDKMNNPAKARWITIEVPYASEGEWNLPSGGLAVDWLRIKDDSGYDGLDEPAYELLRPEKLFVHTT